MPKLPVLLIVDDQPAHLASLTTLLEPTYRLRVAKSGEKALKLAEMLPQPDLILLDIQLPDMSGYEVLKALNQRSSTQDIPVIFVTVEDDPYAQAHGLECGAVDYIVKPFEPIVLQARVHRQLENKAKYAKLKQPETSCQDTLHEQQRGSDVTAVHQSDVQQKGAPRKSFR